MLDCTFYCAGLHLFFLAKGAICCTFYKVQRSVVPAYTLAANFNSASFFQVLDNVLGLSSLRKQEIYDHYYGFFFTAPFMLIGGLVQIYLIWFRNKNFMVKSIAYCLVPIAFLPLIIINLKNNPIKNQPNRQLQRSLEVARVIEVESLGREFNLAVIAERNYEGAYQYFLENDGAPMVMIDAQRSAETIKDQLFVICELAKEKCDPTHNPKAEVANFGWSKIEWQKEVSGTILYKLVHY